MLDIQSPLEMALAYAGRGWPVLSPRFIAQVRVAPGDECWEWTGGRDKDGYGLFHYKSRVGAARAHRYAWGLELIPKGMLVLHRCDNPPCVRRDHLFLGTPQDNMTDKVQKGRHVSGMAVRPERAARGEGNGNSKLTAAQVLEIRSMSDCPRAEIAALFGVTVAAIKDIRSRTTWRWLDA